MAFVLGASVLHLAIFAVLALHIAYKPVLWLVLAACVGIALRTGDWRWPAAEEAAPETQMPRAVRYVFGVIAAVFTTLYLFNAWAPEISPDGASYHLGLTARYLRARGFERITTNMLATFSGGVDMLYVPAFAIGTSFGGRAAAFHVSDRAGADGAGLRTTNRQAAGGSGGRAAGVCESGGGNRRDHGV